MGRDHGSLGSAWCRRGGSAHLIAAPSKLCGSSRMQSSVPKDRQPGLHPTFRTPLAPDDWPVLRVVASDFGTATLSLIPRRRVTLIAASKNGPEARCTLTAAMSATEGRPDKVLPGFDGRFHPRRSPIEVAGSHAAQDGARRTRYSGGSGAGSIPSSTRMCAKRAGDARRLSAIIARSAARPCSVK